MCCCRFYDLRTLKTAYSHPTSVKTSYFQVGDSESILHLLLRTCCLQEPYRCIKSRPTEGLPIVIMAFDSELCYGIGMVIMKKPGRRL